jgi:hypothetical protein
MKKILRQICKVYFQSLPKPFGSSPQSSSAMHPIPNILGLHLNSYQIGRRKMQGAFSADPDSIPPKSGKKTE